MAKCGALFYILFSYDVSIPFYLFDSTWKYAYVRVYDKHNALEATAPLEAFIEIEILFMYAATHADVYCL